MYNTVFAFLVVPPVRMKMKVTKGRLEQESALGFRRT
jgi:hypothetical protein